MAEGSDRKVWVHSDQPCDGDPLEDLGAELTAAAVADIALAQDGPFTIGVFGDWGSGKTTVLDRAARLCEDDKTVVLRLNPWEHEREPDPLASLVVEFVREIRSQIAASKPATKWWQWKHYKPLANPARRAWKWLTLKQLLATMGGVLTLVGIPAGPVFILTAGVLPALAKGELPPTRTSTRRKLEEAVGEDGKVVVFLDDLDRCQPDRALAVLEAVKHLLWAKGFVFVLALDKSVLEAYLEKLHAEDFGVTRPGMGKRYLEKLVQVSVPVAHRDEKSFQKYVEKIVHEAIDGNKSWLPVSAEFGGVHALLNAAARFQPRQAKRLVNNLVVSWSLAPEGFLNEDGAAAGIALSHVLLELLGDRDSQPTKPPEEEREDKNSLPTYAEFVASPEWDARHRAFKNALALAARDLYVRERLADAERQDQATLFRDVSRRLGIENVIEDHAFWPWLEDRTLRMKCSRFAASNEGTTDAIAASADQIEIVLEGVRRSLNLDRGAEIPDRPQVERLELEPGQTIGPCGGSHSRTGRPGFKILTWAPLRFQIRELSTLPDLGLSKSCLWETLR